MGGKRGPYLHIFLEFRILEREVALFLEIGLGCLRPGARVHQGSGPVPGTVIDGLVVGLIVFGGDPL